MRRRAPGSARSEVAASALADRLGRRRFDETAVLGSPPHLFRGRRRRSVLVPSRRQARHLRRRAPRRGRSRAAAVHPVDAQADRQSRRMPDTPISGTSTRRGLQAVRVGADERGSVVTQTLWSTTSIAVPRPRSRACSTSARRVHRCLRRDEAHRGQRERDEHERRVADEERQREQRERERRHPADQHAPGAEATEGQVVGQPPGEDLRRVHRAPGG